MFSSVKEILDDAMNNKYAVGAFNVSNMEMAQAVVDAAVEKKSPLVIQITESAMKYAGSKEITKIVKIIIEERSEDIPIGINLDHGKTFELCKNAIDIGFNEVMIDGSRLSFRENMELTKRVVAYAHSKDVAVQGELGIVPYLGEIDFGDTDWSNLMTDPDHAKQFTNETKVDFLAIAIGNAHGFVHEAEKPDWERLAEIRSLLKIPLVLHGASDWSEEKVTTAIQSGINCFNVDTSIRLAFIHQLCKMIGDKCSVTDPRQIMGEVRNAIRKKVTEKILLFGSAGKA